MVDNDRAQAILALQHAFVVNLIDIQDFQKIREEEITQDELVIASALNIIEQNIDIIKDKIFNIETPDIDHIKNLYSTGLFPVETLAHMYSCPDNRIKEIVKDCQVVKNDIVDKVNNDTMKRNRETICSFVVENSEYVERKIGE